jgi:hypothetical protein
MIFLNNGDIDMNIVMHGLSQGVDDFIRNHQTREKLNNIALERTLHEIEMNRQASWERHRAWLEKHSNA